MARYIQNQLLKDHLGAKLARDLFNINIQRGPKLTDREAAILNKTEADLPTSSGIANADDIDLENIASSAYESTKDLITVLKDSKQTSTDDLFEHPLRELLGLDRTMKTIRGTLMAEVAKKVELSEHIDRERRKLAEIENDTSYTDDQREEIRERIRRLNNELNIRQESIDLLKGRLSNQITAVKETIAKVLDRDTSLAEKIRTLFREQGITIASILTAIGMAIGVLVEALLPSGGSAAVQVPDKGETPGKDNADNWIRNKLKALANLLGKLADKALDALPGIIGSIIAWVMNRAKEVVGWLSQNLWALIVGIGGLIYTYLVTRK